MLESGLPQWIVLRQTAMFSDDLLKNNMNDGLMFHTRLDSPLEWVSDKDSATLLSRIVTAKEEGRLSERFFIDESMMSQVEKRSRVYGYQVFSIGLSLAGLSFRKVFRPKDFVTRNFHGVWYGDEIPLQEMFSYQNDSIYDYFESQRKNIRYGRWQGVFRNLSSAIFYATSFLARTKTHHPFGIKGRMKPE